MFYFVGILSRVGYIFLPSCPQVFSLLKVEFKNISKSHKSLVQFQSDEENPLKNNLDT